MNDLQSLVNTIITDRLFSKLLGYKMHLLQDNICLDNAASSNSDIHIMEYLNAKPQHMGYRTVLMEQRLLCKSNSDITRLTWIIYRHNSASIKSIFQQKLRMSALCILIMPTYDSAYAKCTLLKWIQNYALHK